MKSAILFLGLCLFAVLAPASLPSTSESSDAEMQAIQSILQAGGRVDRSNESLERPVIEVNLDVKNVDGILPKLKHLKHLRGLWLRDD